MHVSALNLILASGIQLPLLGGIVAMFVASVAIAYLCYRIKLVPIVGFLVAGILLGPGALGLIEDIELVEATADIGVILLLFTIGAEFSIGSFARLGKTIFLAGSLQVGLTVAITAVAIQFLGASWQTGVFSGFLVALSSTAIVLSLMKDSADTDTPAGNLSLAILIFQDLAMVVMVLLIPILGGHDGSLVSLVVPLVKAFIIIGLVMVFARKVVPWLLDKVAATRRSELFLLAVVAICLGTAWLTSLVGVSVALGAFLGGLIVSESRYSEQALSEILPLRTIFNAIFFVSVGMLLDFQFLMTHLPIVLLVGAGILVLKILATTGGILAMGFPVRVAAIVALSLAQIGEFSFVLARTGIENGLTPMGIAQDGYQTFIAVSILLMVITPGLVGAAPRIGMWLNQTPLGSLGTDVEAPGETHGFGLEDHVIIVGYGPAGQRLVSVLHESGIPFVVIEMNPGTIKTLQSEGVNAIYGDATRAPILKQAGIETAKMIVVVINDRAAALRTTQLARFANPTLEVVVRTRFLSAIEVLQEAGADVVVPEELETSIRIFTYVLGSYMFSPEEINQHISAIRTGDYKVFRGSIHEAHLMVLQGLDEEGLHTRAVAVRPGSVLEHCSLAELDLRSRYGMNVLAIRRAGHTIGNPAGDTRLEAGDRLVIIARAAEFAATADLFRPGPHTTTAA